jgi:hypothetical protein
MVVYAWRGPFGNAEVSQLHSEAFGHAEAPADDAADDDWWQLVNRHGFGWVCGRVRAPSSAS